MFTRSMKRTANIKRRQLATEEKQQNQDHHQPRGKKSRRHYRWNTCCQFQEWRRSCPTERLRVDWRRRPSLDEGTCTLPRLCKALVSPWTSVCIDERCARRLRCGSRRGLKETIVSFCTTYLSSSNICVTDNIWCSFQVGVIRAEAEGWRAL